MIALFFSALIYVFGFIAVHLLCCRIFGNRRFFFFNLVLFLLFFAVAAGFQIRTQTIEAVFFWAFCLGSFWVTYTTVLVNVQNSVSLGILQAIEESPTGALSKADIEQATRMEKAVGERVKRIQQNGFIEYDQNEIVLSMKGQWLGRIAQTFRKILNITDCG